MDTGLAVDAYATCRAAIFNRFTTALDSRGIEYAILGRVDDYPEGIDSDVDFVVSRESLAEVAALLGEDGVVLGARLLQAVWHETGVCFVLASRDTPHVFLNVDACADFRRKGHLWVSARQLLQGRRRHSAGFWIPSIPSAFLYYLIKRIDKKEINSAQLAYLRSLYKLDEAECRAAVTERFGEKLSAHLMRVVSTPAKNPTVEELDDYRTSMYTSSVPESFVDRGLAYFAELRRRIDRILRPTGLVIGFLGPDGSGKSTLIESVKRDVGPAFRGVQYFHLRPGRFFTRKRSGGAVTDPHGMAPRSTIASWLKLALMLVDYTFGYFLSVFPKVRRASLIIFDRYIDDMLVDPQRYRWGGQSLLPLRGATRVVPRPDLWFILDAPASVLQARKQEVSEAVSEQHRQGYLALYRRLDGATVIDTTLSASVCAAKVTEIIFDRLEERARSKNGRGG